MGLPKTYLSVANDILLVVQSHLMVEYIFSGAIDKLDDQIEFKGKTGWLSLESVSLENGKKNYRFNLIMLDKENSDRSNEEQIQSDCIQILVDIAGRLNTLQLNQGRLNVDGANITPFIEQHNGYLAGATLTFDYITLEPYDSCNAPFDDNPIPTSGGQYIYPSANYLTCNTLEDCLIIQTIQDDIIALSGQTGGDFVPYTGATKNVDLGEFEIKAGQFTLDTSPTGTAAVGTTRWNDSLGSSETTLKGGSVVLKNGVDLVTRVVNKVSPNTTLTKANYAAVKVSGAQGQRLAVAYAQADDDLNSADTIGLVCETIPTNQEGFILCVGLLENINTTGSLQGENWNDGDVIYLSPTTPGALTKVKPNGFTGHIVVIGYVEYAHQNNGKLYVKIMNGWELDELHNVGISGVTNGQSLIYNSSNGLWQNGTPTIPDDIPKVLYRLPSAVNVGNTVAVIVTTLTTFNITGLATGTTIVADGLFSSTSSANQKTYVLSLSGASTNPTVAATTGSFRTNLQMRVQGSNTIRMSLTNSFGVFSVNPGFVDVTGNNGVFTLVARCSVNGTGGGIPVNTLESLSLTRF